VRLERFGAEEVRRLGAEDLRRSGAEGTGGLSRAERVAADLRARVPRGEEVAEDVRAIIAEVARGGDGALIEFTRRLDTGGAEPRPLLVDAEDLDAAIGTLPLELVAGLQVAIANVAQVAQAGVGEDVTVDLSQGQRVTLREVPVGSAAVYVPGGRAPYPSTVVMGVVTARAAGVLDVVVCSPPGRDGEIDPVILGTCRLLGVERVYRMGGAQAIAALALGTETVRRVDVIVGPGNLYVQEAKRLLSEEVGIDGFAGPSDLLVVFGEDADRAGRPGGADRGARGRAREPRAGRVRAGGVRGRAGGDRDRERLRARAPGAGWRRPRGAGAEGAERRLSARGRGLGDGLRRLRGGLKPRVAHGGGGALRVGSLGQALPPSHVGGQDRPRWRGEAGEGRRPDRPRGGL
jgi:hypothetical protein